MQNENQITEEQLLINEEYKLWKKNTPHLYDLIISHVLEWPSLTVEWLPGSYEPDGQDYAVQKLILGTQTYGNYPNYLMIAEVQLPVVAEGDTFDAQRFDISASADKVKLTQLINHDGEVHRARFMPQNPSVIATKTVYPEVFIFDSSKHPSRPPLDGKCNPDLSLRGHNDEGFGLSWSKFKQSHLLSSSKDGKICLWDIQATPNNKTLDAKQTFKFHMGGVRDVAWHLRHEYLFGSVGDDGHLNIQDLRNPSAYQPTLGVTAHQSEVNCLAFNPLNEWVLATGSTDMTVKVFDLRKLTSTLHTLDSHGGNIKQTMWNPKNETVLASSCSSRSLMVWDLNRFDMEQTPEEAEEGPPELLFLHGGHTSMISDFSWNPCEDWLVASVDADKTLHIWQMAEGIHCDADDLIISRRGFLI